MYQYVQIPFTQTSTQQHPTDYTTSEMKWYWAPRTGRLKWDLMESIDVDEIVRKGDLGAVEFYLQSLINANITKEDAKNFGSKGALNMFMLMQLGLDYLLTQIHNYSVNAVIDQQKQYSDTVSEVSARYEQTLMHAQQQIAERDATIVRLRQNIQQLNNDAAQAKHIVKKLKQKIKNQKEIIEVTKKEAKRKKIAKEPGLIDIDTQYKDLEKLQKAAKMHFNRTTVMKPKRDSNLSDGEIDIASLTYRITDSF